MSLMIVAMLMATYFKPYVELSSKLSPVDIEKMIPREFNGWHEINTKANYIVNPELNDTLSKTYDQVLSRLYVKNNHPPIMLSVAYTENQSNKSTIHMPEICYPAQGYQVKKHKSKSQLITKFGPIPVNQFIAEKPGRIESVSYWAMVGTKVVTNSWQLKFEQVKYGLRGYITDGLLFRVSIENTNINQAYASEEIFINDMMTAIQMSDRKRLAGLHTN
ncbi:exosortase-associated protein EpsI, B-type [Methylophilus aquaticus]|nr:exosortase-associated protein EpsI, B-type [Methylophilus aquaticus]